MLIPQPQIFASNKKSEANCKLVNGTRIYYEVKGNGQPLVFIHDFALDHRMWDNQFHYFSKWYQCIRFDLRGYGQSALPGAEKYSYHNDIKSLLHELNITEPAILVGLSLGSLVAINFALQFPAFTKGLVLVSPQVEGYTFKNFKLDAIYTRARDKGIDYAKRKWFAHPLFDHARKNKPLSESLWQMIQFYSGWHLVDKTQGLVEEIPAWNNLENINTPSLILSGEFDIPDFRELSDAITFRIPGAKRIIIPAAGHITNMENPVAFNRELQGFLSGVMAD